MPCLIAQIHFNLPEMFHLLVQDQIDIQKWKSLSSKYTIFSQDWLLSSFCSWKLLILGDYEGGMPIPFRRRFGMLEMYQPEFIQLCEWCGTQPDPTELRAFLESSFSHLHFNCNLLMEDVLTERNNYYLPISSDPESLRSAYRKNAQRNIKKQDELHLDLELSDDIDFTIELFRKEYGALTAHLDETAYQKLKVFVNERQGTSAFNYQVIQQTEDNGKEVVAVLLFFEFNQRFHYILGAQTDDGRKCNAMTIAFDKLICSPDNYGKILDFEGSNIESIAHFYKGFGSSLSTFYEYKWIPNPIFRMAVRLKKLLR